jgi:hypothetical protein
MSGEKKPHMRNLVQPSPSVHCEHCDGELRFKLIKADNRTPLTARIAPQNQRDFRCLPASLVKND